MLVELQSLCIFILFYSLGRQTAINLGQRQIYLTQLRIRLYAIEPKKKKKIISFEFICVEN